ncbi:hypothetical protein COV12_00080, partial [Candidatus Woesearchaeota archaeon CG10_big_fil_rev_8_21_14_0_10_32_24]
DERSFLHDIEKLIKQKIEVMDHKFHSESAKNAVGTAAKPTPKERGTHRPRPGSNSKTPFTKMYKGNSKAKGGKQRRQSARR